MRGKPDFRSLGAMLILGLALTFASIPVQADSAGVVCAAVFPCKQNGSLLPQFDSTDSPCLDFYLSQCAQFKQEQEKETLLLARIKHLEAENSTLKKQLKSIKRRVKAARFRLR